MTPDEARKLLGGYATGSLSEAERTALFQAALEDQELFDELADETALKEVLDEPGARQRLITALEPPKKHRMWLWATAAATLAVAVVIGIVVSNKTPPPPQQIAQVMKSPEPAVTPAAPVVPPISQPALRKTSPPAPPPEPPPELKKEENTAVAAQADQLQEAKPQAAAGGLRQFAAAAPAPSVFAFDYTVGADGFLQIVPAAAGFLAVTANNAVVFPSGAVNPGMPIRISIPPDASSLVISFSRTPGITGSPIRRDQSAGRETDQDPPNGRILIQVFLTPATR